MRLRVESAIDAHKKFFFSILFLFGLTVIAGIVFSDSLLNALSRNLVYKDPLAKSEAIVVLSGSATGNRILVAAQLFHKGFGDKLVFSGYQVYPETFSSTLMKNYALKLGVPEEKIIASIPDMEVSTRGESIANIELLKKHKIKSFILVTSAYHTRRSKINFENAISHLGYSMKFLVYPAVDPLVPVQGWWKLRTGQKGIFIEYLKSIGHFFGL